MVIGHYNGLTVRWKIEKTFSSLRTSSDKKKLLGNRKDYCIEVSTRRKVRAGYLDKNFAEFFDLSRPPYESTYSSSRYNLQILRGHNHQAPMLNKPRTGYDCGRTVDGDEKTFLHCKKYHM